MFVFPAAGGFLAIWTHLAAPPEKQMGLGGGWIYTQATPNGAPNGVKKRRLAAQHLDIRGLRCAEEDGVKKTTWQNGLEGVGEAGSLTVWTFGPLHHSRASGNLVKIEDGCATVKGYKLPRATVVCVRRTDGKAGARLRPKSGYRFGCARRGSLTPGSGC